MCYYFYQVDIKHFITLIKKYYNLITTNLIISCSDKFVWSKYYTENCGCFPPCEEVLYDVSYSLSKWPATGYEGDAAFIDIFHVVNFTDRFEDPAKFEIVQEYFNETYREEGMKDFARLNVYIADSNVIKTEETPDYNTNQ